MSIINIQKSLISKKSIIYFISKHDNFDIKEIEDSWILTTQKNLTENEIHDVKRVIIRIENTLYIENKISPIREILYKKAFSPINHD